MFFARVVRVESGAFSWRENVDLQVDELREATICRSPEMEKVTHSACGARLVLVEWVCGFPPIRRKMSNGWGTRVVRGRAKSNCRSLDFDRFAICVRDDTVFKFEMTLDGMEIIRRRG
jgi:hypothetical protein